MRGIRLMETFKVGVHEDMNKEERSGGGQEACTWTTEKQVTGVINTVHCKELFLESTKL